MDTQTQTVNALSRLVAHCREMYPHFESPRGQRDIADAITEHHALVSALRAVVNSYDAPHRFDRTAAILAARTALVIAEGK